MNNLKGIKVKSVDKSNNQDVYDINVDDVHHYILKGGYITHNTMDLFPQEVMKGGRSLYYSASNITFLTKAKLKTGQEDEHDMQSGIIVTAKAVKNRQVKPKKVKFEISFEKGCNPYVGLDMFCTPENFEELGIAKGKYEKYKTPKEMVDEDTGEITVVEGEFKKGGNRWYIRHLDKMVWTKNLFTSKVFTPEVLDKIDMFAQEYFKYNSMDDMVNEDEDDDTDDDYIDKDLDDTDIDDMF